MLKIFVLIGCFGFVLVVLLVVEIYIDFDWVWWISFFDMLDGCVLDFEVLVCQDLDYLVVDEFICDVVLVRVMVWL